MALFEYRCNACGHVFEALVHSNDDGPVCPTCGSKDLEKMLSTFAVNAKASSPAGSCPNAGCCGGACGLS